MIRDTDKEYRDFMLQYATDHELCPKCGYDICESTYMAFTLFLDDKQSYKDKNICTCSACKDKHTMHERVSRDEYSKMFIDDKRETINLDARQHMVLCLQRKLIIGDTEVPIEVVEMKYDSSERDYEKHHLVFKKLSNGKLFRVEFLRPVNVDMEWKDFNKENRYYLAEEVF